KNQIRQRRLVTGQLETCSERMDERLNDRFRPKAVIRYLQQLKTCFILIADIQIPCSRFLCESKRVFRIVPTVFYLFG
ncbi:hypothetical protein BOW50_11030, partial [Solemya velum gill symbiont]